MKRSFFKFEHTTFPVRIYLLLAVFPGCCCSHILRISAYPSISIESIVIVLLPFILLSVILFGFRIAISKEKAATITKRQRSMLSIALIAISIIFLILFVDISAEVNHLLKTRSGSESRNLQPFAIQWLAGWGGAASLGLGLLFLGYSFLEEDNPEENNL